MDRELPIYQKYSVETNGKLLNLSAEELACEETYLDMKLSGGANRKSRALRFSPSGSRTSQSSLLSSNPLSSKSGKTEHTMGSSSATSVGESPTTNLYPLAKNTLQVGHEDSDKHMFREKMNTVKSMWNTRLKSRKGHREKYAFLTHIITKFTGGKENIKETFGENLEKNNEDTHEIYTYQLQEALEKSYPFHNSDLPGISPSPHNSLSRLPQSIYPYSSGIGGNKIRIDPVSHMVYFDDSSSRRAFSLIRTNEANPTFLNKRSTTMSQSVRRARLRMYQKSSTRKALKQRHRAATVGARFMGSPFRSEDNSGSTNCSGVSSKSVLRSKVNINSAQEIERLMEQQAERQQHWAARHDGFDDSSSEDSIPREKQYPRGSRSSVKELYSAMRQAQVADYCMNYQVDQ